MILARAAAAKNIKSAASASDDVRFSGGKLTAQAKDLMLYAEALQAPKAGGEEETA